MRVYLAEWNDCTYESGFETISVHATRAGAQAVIDAKVAEEETRWQETQRYNQSRMKDLGLEWQESKFGPMFGKAAQVRSIKVKK